MTTIINMTETIGLLDLWSFDSEKGIKNIYILNGYIPEIKWQKLDRIKFNEYTSLWFKRMWKFSYVGQRCYKHIDNYHKF